MTGAVVRARAPLRLGLAGGGTDLSPYCDQFGGAVLNLTVDRYAYVFLEALDEPYVRFVARDVGIEEVLPLDPEAIAKAKLQLHAGTYLRMMRDFNAGQLRAFCVTSFVDAPMGSGLGSSSALAVTLIEAFRTYLSLPLGPYDVAHMAFEVERLDLGLAGGKQDQYAAAFGGANFVEFLAGDRVIVNPLRVPRAVLNEIETSLVTCFTGVSRRSERIIEEQQRGMAIQASGALEGLHQLKRDAVEMKQALLRGDVAHMAEILNRSWEAKKRTASGISTELIDRLFETAMAHGAMAGKVSGAGGGGFVMFLVPPQRRVEVIAGLSATGATPAAVHLTDRGAEGWTAPDLASGRTRPGAFASV